MKRNIMRGPLSPLVLVAVVAALAVTAACGKKDDANPESRQVELTPAGAAQPQLGDTATAPAPVVAAQPAPKPKPTPARAPAVVPTPAAVPTPTPSRTATGVIAGGLSMASTMNSRVCTNTHKVGDRITATLDNMVHGTNGAMIPAGATVTLRVSESQRGENGKEGIRLQFEPVAVTFDGSTYGIDGTAVMTQMETVRSQSTGDQAKKVATGAVLGAIAGQIIGKRAKTAAVGAAVGAAAGGAVAVGSADWNACLGEGAHLTITLGSPVTVKVGAGM